MLLTKFDMRVLRRSHFSDRSIELAMLKAIKIYYPNRANSIARERAKSAIEIIRIVRA